jgi:hypothetical protein
MPAETPAQVSPFVANSANNLLMHLSAAATNHTARINSRVAAAVLIFAA